MRGEEACPAGEDVQWEVFDGVDDRTHDAVIISTTAQVRTRTRNRVYEPLSHMICTQVGGGVDAEITAWSND